MKSHSSRVKHKISEVNVDLGDSANEKNSNKSKSNGSNLSRSQGNKSKESYISGSTLYKFQKISHREKIKKLEA